MTMEPIERELNRLYAIDLGKYKEECDDWKSKGYKIYRDTKGRHKVVEPPKHNDVYNDAYNILFDAIFSRGGQNNR